MKAPIFLILGARAPIALELSRSFHAQGLKVILADSLRFPIGRWSNSIAHFERLPKARQNTMEFVETISKLIIKYSITDIIPCCEEVFYIAKHKNNWNCKVWTSDIKLMNLLHNKETFAREFKDFLTIPETISLEKFSNWSQSDTYVFKPKYSRFASSTILNTLIHSNTINDPENWIAQKKVTGIEVCVYTIWDSGKLKGYSCYVPLYRVKKGAAIYFEHFENSQLKEKIKKFGEYYLYSGQLSFDVIISDNTFWFLECNPRGTSGAHLLRHSLAGSFYNDVVNTITDKNDYMLTSVLLFTKPFVFLSKKVQSAKGVIFSWQDPVPSFLQLISVLELIYIKLSKGISLTQATTYDIEWNGHED
ncbi:ATP-grasp domain-containing protein [Polaribacter litorisediminis]|uniref:ATP-grasp domain-containing protein n=1 Tax=Polaribacter litorisediminis TaxID=1908341 RepID=UPI001CBB27AC|nr:ATP-grasp domain-containing protein [Polaribacter litorisediminis]UAM99215.1 ATP-grasp domain-containing protein [Polaribacter litorisediminis]